jgi:hypothetical protein
VRSAPHRLQPVAGGAPIRSRSGCGSGLGRATNTGTPPHGLRESLAPRGVRVTGATQESREAGGANRPPCGRRVARSRLQAEAAEAKGMLTFAQRWDQRVFANVVENLIQRGGDPRSEAHVISREAPGESLGATHFAEHQDAARGVVTTGDRYSPRDYGSTPAEILPPPARCRCFQHASRAARGRAALLLDGTRRRAKTGLPGDGASRSRTGDLLLAKQALYQLSYGPAGHECTSAPGLDAHVPGRPPAERNRPHGQHRAQHRRRRPRPRRLRPVDPVRGVPELHGGLSSRGCGS